MVVLWISARHTILTTAMGAHLSSYLAGTGELTDLIKCK
jgi:hypothetical protein